MEQIPLLLCLGYRARSRTRLGNEQANFHAAVLLAAVAGLIVGHRHGIAGTQGRDATHRNLVLIGQITGYFLRASLTQCLVDESPDRSYP